MYYKLRSKGAKCKLQIKSWSENNDFIPLRNSNYPIPITYPVPTKPVSLQLFAIGHEICKTESCWYIYIFFWYTRYT